MYGRKRFRGSGGGYSRKVHASNPRTTGIINRYQPSGPELKWLDTLCGNPINAERQNIAFSQLSRAWSNLSDPTIVTTGFAAGTAQYQANTLVAIPQGVGPSQRIGQRVDIRKIFIQGYVAKWGTADSFMLWGNNTEGNGQDPNSNVNSPTHQEYVKICLVLDSQCNGTAVTGAGIYGYNGIFYYDNILAFRSTFSFQRFKILKEVTVKLDSGAVIGVSQPTGDPPGTTNEITIVDAGVALNKFGMYLSCKIPINYRNDSTTGEVATIRDNNIFLVGVTLLQSQLIPPWSRDNLLAAVDYTAHVYWTCRVRYYDN